MEDIGQALKDYTTLGQEQTAEYLQQAVDTVRDIGCAFWHLCSQALKSILCCRTALAGTRNWEGRKESEHPSQGAWCCGACVVGVWLFSQRTSYTWHNNCHSSHSLPLLWVRLPFWFAPLYSQ